MGWIMRPQFLCVCTCVLVSLFLPALSGKTVEWRWDEERGREEGGRYEPLMDSGDVIMREDAEEVFLGVDLDKYEAKGVTCPTPNAPQNGHITGEGEKLIVGSVVYVSCDEGFWLRGASVMDCVPSEEGEEGVWQPEGERVCVEGSPEFEEENHSESRELELPDSPEVLPDMDLGPKYLVLSEGPGEKQLPMYLPKIESTRMKHRGAVVDMSDDEMSQLQNSPVIEMLASAPGYCKLPAEKGPCKAAFQRWYFDAQTGECVSFVYGGCQGNQNNFQSIEECNKACFVAA